MGVPTDPTSNKILYFFSFWCLLALPINYFTCSVERNSIPPLQSVLNKTVNFPITINYHCITNLSSKSFCSSLNNRAANQAKKRSSNLIINSNIYTNTEIINNCKSSYNDGSYLSCLEMYKKDQINKIGSYDIYFINTHKYNNDASWIISPYRSAWNIINEQLIDLNMDNIYNNMIFGSDSHGSHANLSLNIGIFAQIFSFTLLNSEPLNGYNFEWNMNEIYNNYLRTFFNRISNVLIYDYYIDSQILYYGYIISQAPTDNIHVDKTSFSQIFENYISSDSDSNSYYVTAKELSTFIGGTDWNRQSSLTNDLPPIEFIIYIPPKQYYPLYIRDGTSTDTYNAFIVPRFGGCIIYNPVLNNTNINNSKRKKKIKINTNELYDIFNIVISQLRMLFGLKNDYNNNNNENELYLMDLSGINEYELDILIRLNIFSDLETVVESLRNIYVMIDSISQLPINNDVALLISDAIYAYNQALNECNINQNYIKCIQWTKRSNYLAKKAEYHPSMLPALYFSPEFTYAVYSPYFLPGYIPIVAALFKKFKSWYKNKKTRNKLILEKTDIICE